MRVAALKVSHPAVVLPHSSPLPSACAWRAFCSEQLLTDVILAAHYTLETCLIHEQHTHCLTVLPPVIYHFRDLSIDLVNDLREESIAFAHLSSECVCFFRC